VKRLVIAITIAAAAVLPAQAQLGNLGGMLGGGAKSSGGDISAMVGEFVKDNALIRDAVSYSLMQIVAALGDKQQIAVVKARSDSLAKTTDAKEIGSIQGQLITEQSVIAQQLLESKEARARIEKLSPAMQAKVGQSILAVGVASLRIPGMMDKGKRVMEGVGSNPMNISKVAPVKDGIGMFADSAPKIAKIASTGYELMKAVKVDPGKPTLEAKLEPNKEVAFPE
jgi:hypothetical protein